MIGTVVSVENCLNCFVSSPRFFFIYGCRVRPGEYKCKGYLVVVIEETIRHFLLVFEELVDDVM